MKTKPVQKFALKSIEVNRLNQLPLKGNINKDFMPLIFSNLSKDDLMPLRILLILALNFKDYQIHNKEQLQLFNQQWMELDNDYLLQVTGKYSDFLPDGTKNYDQVKKALAFLSDIKIRIEDNDKYIDAPIISNLVVLKRRGFKFALNSYWIEKFINVSNFISFDKESVLKINSFYGMIMYMYINSFPYIKTADKDFSELTVASKVYRGGKVKLSTIKQLLNIPENLPISKVKEKRLDPLRSLLNQKSTTSFNYKIEKGNFIFVAYKTNSLEVQTSDQVEINKFVRFIEQRKIKHKLDDLQTYMFTASILAYDLNFIQKTLARKACIKNSYGEDFINSFTTLREQAINKALAQNIDYSGKLNAEQKNKILKKFALK